MEDIIAEFFFDKAHYDLMWTRRYFCPYDVNHYLFEVVKDKETKELKVHAYDTNGKFQKEIPKNVFMAGYKDFLFYDALCYDPTWLV